MTTSEIARDPAVGAPLLIDTLMPAGEVTVVAHLVVAADPATTYRAARSLDLLTVRSPLISVAMWLRGLPSRLGRSPAVTPARLVVGDGIGMPGWGLLGERPDREIVFGAVGRFWSPDIVWCDVPAVEFTGFAEPGWGKIAANFSVLPYGESSTLLSYECRTSTTDAVSWRRFARYWWLIRPFVGLVLRASLRTIRIDAEKQPVR
ncbi:hypothetical protein [Amycolatopsis sp. H20-H5]|uniref:hypothetical protein n=1 Tax=Amycolatopsis sp. H20-H5 TaxID=3046309 RepID=UPI002DB9F688|nr:hypothetical protein [Amycolatopsis sp. H20-H5]MEC3982686.1 hypothetical protein [Amycolatopsis sp. H20-H5]